MAGNNYLPEAHRLHEKLEKEAVEGGYMLNPDREFTLRLVQGLLDNVRRFGYAACPCRLAYGDKARDIDLICPCYYRDPDLEEFGTCYCTLYVNDDWVSGKFPHKSIPDRRPAEFVLNGYSEPEQEPAASGGRAAALSHPVWRCKVCGYLAARDEPPGKCPVCKATKDRFERFM
ncbi:MAG: ferredoxin-thioredoxin reductase catalytic domain-containing protein [bacterium]